MKFGMKVSFFTFGNFEILTENNYAAQRQT